MRSYAAKSEKGPGPVDLRDADAPKKGIATRRHSQRFAGDAAAILPGRDRKIGLADDSHAKKSYRVSCSNYMQQRFFCTLRGNSGRIPPIERRLHVGHVSCSNFLRSNPEAHMAQDLDQLCINTLRFLSVDMVQRANSGHPGMPLGAAPMAYVLWTRWLKHNPRNPRWFDRDRFVLSAGHGSALLYSLLHMTGYDLSLDDIQHFRQWGSKAPGTSGARPHTRRRNHHRTPRPRPGEFGRHGDRRGTARRSLQPA